MGLLNAIGSILIDKAKKYAARAILFNEETSKVVEQFSNAGYTVENQEMLTQVKNNIDNIMNKPRITRKDVARLKEYTNITQYDYIKIDLPIRGEEIDGIQVAEEKPVDYGDIRRAIKRQVISPNKVTEEQQQLISHYAQATAQYQNTRVSDLSTPEAQKQFKKGFNIIRDVSIGGNSTLINDLSYTYDALNAGRDFVELLQSIMADKNNFVLIETWYRYTDEGKETQFKIDQAVKKYWYEGFKDFSATIIEAINNMPNLSKEGNKSLDDFQSAMEVSADEYI